MVANGYRHYYYIYHMERLKKYEDSGPFFFYPSPVRKDCFRECNAPSDRSGVYLIYGISNNIEDLVYIGLSGKLLPNGEMKHRRGGIRDRLVNGKYAENGIKITRYIYWLRMMEKEGFDRLRIQWHVTHNNNYLDCPSIIENELIYKFSPRWNRK